MLQWEVGIGYTCYTVRLTFGTPPYASAGNYYIIEGPQIKICIIHIQRWVCSDVYLPCAALFL